MRLATLVDGTCVAVDGDGYAPLPGKLVDHLQRPLLAETLGRRPISEARFGPPLRPPKVICLGLNYADHIEESGQARPERPLLFSKLPSTVIGQGQLILRPQGATKLDYEAELAVVIGRPGRHIAPENANSHIGGYACFNDVSEREAQLTDGQWFRGKSFATFGPLGPFIVTGDELEDPHALDITCTVNGEVRQQSNTRHLVFQIPEIIAFCSRSFELEPGDVIATGTPGGVGLASGRWLVPGDVVEVSIAGIGTLRNEVGEAPS